MTRRSVCAIVCACVGAATALVRCTSDDTSACDACSDIAPSPLVVAATPSEIWVHPSDAPSIAIALARGPGGDGDVSVSVECDAGVGADPLVIAASAWSGTLVLHIEPAFSQGSATVTIDAATSATLAQATLIVHVAGSSGALDTTFGANGVADLSPTSGSDVGASLIALQSGVLVGGTHTEANDASATSTMSVLRLTSAGASDGTFAATSAPGELASLAILPFGTIYAVGTVRTTKADFAAVRILAAGGVDPTYVAASVLTAGDDVGAAAAIEPGGLLVAAGSTNDQSGFGVARYTQSPQYPADASTDATLAPDSKNTSVLDPMFGNGGAVITPLAAPSGARALLVGLDGSLYALGFSNGNIAAAHYSTAGVMDTAFADGGVALYAAAAGAAAAAFQGSGAIVIASDDGAQALVARMLANGTLDAAFGVNGIASLAFGTTSSARAIVIDPASGDVIVGGFTNAPHQCLVARLTATGLIDTTFANGGSITIAQGDACDVAAIAIDDDGKIVVLETITSSGATHMAVARYWP